jgi:cytoskeletal protein RodZ
MEPEAAGKVIGEKKVKPRTWPRAAAGSVIALIILVAAVVVWKIYTQPAHQTEKAPIVVRPSAEVAPKEKVTSPLPEKVTKPAPPKEEMASKEKQESP